MINEREDKEVKRINNQAKLIDDNKKWWLRFVPDRKKWSDINIARFLIVYKAHPILWDPTHSLYNDQKRRMKAYVMIGRRLNLFGIGERECIRLVESLKSIYVEEKKRQGIAERCNQKYTPSICWYNILEELIDRVKKKLRKSCDEIPNKMEPGKPWEKCCSKLYTEDIWTPEHFRTDILNWFLPPEDEEQPFCDCPELSEINLENICYTGTVSSSEFISDEIIQCMTNEPSLLSSSHSSSYADKECCFELRNSRLPEKCGADVSNEEIKISSGEERNEIEESHFDCCNTSGEKTNDEIISIEKDNDKIIKDTVDQCPLEKVGSYPAEKICTNERVSSEKLNFSPCGTKEFLKFSSTRYDCAACGSVNLSLKSQTSVKKLSTDCCDSYFSKSNSSSVSAANCKSKSSSSSSSKSRSLSQEDGSARSRSDIKPDPTLCKKCAPERVSLIQNRKGKNVILYQDPRMIDLDKYCRYKNWDKIYNIKTEINSNERIEMLKKDLPIKEKKKSSKPNLENHFQVESDGFIFTDQNLSDIKEVSLIDEYKRENGMDIPINKRKHFACKNSDNLDYRSVAQLIL